MRGSSNTSDTWIPNTSLNLLPDTPSPPKFREHFVILIILDTDPRQSAVTLLSSPRTGILCLITIEMVGFSETEGDSTSEHVGRAKRFPSSLRV